MGKTQYSKIKEVLGDIVGQKVLLDRLWNRITVYVGSDERTIKRFMYLMLSLNLIKEVENGVYEILSCEAQL